ncbi:hypothetical protein IHN63_00660 [Deinococcus sp. 6YEL10]|uniref:3'-5' exonuclease n=1 Tax=Deinococcus sp. 6YEL10 TaxID=2745870 RepID=UPI001E465162|nr:exonuclease domain-containing protein [Deinococcus sp. 6YEL10]MCD0159809.1 hypothetical protein [Deinococcus sp. 6YEL10]
MTRHLILSIDTETGGFAPPASLLTVGIVPAILDLADHTVTRIDQPHHRLVRHRNYVTTPEALAVSGIDPTTHDAHPDAAYPAETDAHLSSLLVSLQVVHDFDAASTIFLAHNASFDDKFIRAYLPAFSGWMRGSICTMKLATALRKKKVLNATTSKLAELSRHIGLQQPDLHRADLDADLALSFFEYALPLTRTARIRPAEFITRRTP